MLHNCGASAGRPSGRACYNAPMTAQPVRQSPPRSLRAFAAIALGWSAVAGLLSLQGWLTSANAGRAQPWWPSLGYSFAIFSVWAALTWPVLEGVRRVEGLALRLPARIALYAAGLFVVAALHIGLFVAVYWPLYNDDGRLARWAMGERMFVRNLGTNTLFYAALLGLGLRLARRPAPARPATEALRARSRGAVRIVPLAEVDWIGAAGNYAEAHTGQGSVLLDESLVSLAQRLPGDSFARIHRGAIVRLDRISEVKSLGRGDAEVVLRAGDRLRLSRRYRPALSAWLNGG
jgi:two-component system, LytTR family, response regulator